MINGTEYAYEDVTIVVAGRSIPLIGVKSIEYGEKKNHTNIYGRGNVPVAMGRGKKEYEEGTLVINQSEFEAMQANMPEGKSILDRAPFPITIAYKAEEGPQVVDKIDGARWTGFKKKLGEDDTEMEIELKFLPFKLRYNVR